MHMSLSDALALTETGGAKAARTQRRQEARGRAQQGATRCADAARALRAAWGDVHGGARKTCGGGAGAQPVRVRKKIPKNHPQKNYNLHQSRRLRPNKCALCVAP